MSEQPLTNGGIRAKVESVVDELTLLRADIADHEVPGWIISTPTISEVNSDLAMISARSKPDDHAPYYLPDDAEAVIAVLEGSIRLDAGEFQRLWWGGTPRWLRLGQRALSWPWNRLPESTASTSGRG